MLKAELAPLTVAGIMSGTSADGIDVAIVRIEPTGVEGRSVKLRHAYSTEYPSDFRPAVLAAMDARNTSVAEVARLNWRLGLAYADAAKAALVEYAQPVDLIGCHGQTIYHQGAALPYAGRDFACTWQLGEMSLLAAATGVSVVSNFRPADMAAGGQGAPLVSYLDYVLFRHESRNRVLQNLGGIANLTAMPAGASADSLLAFDTGPANMIVDALMQTLFQRAYDEDGAMAAKGHVSLPIVESCMRDPFFQLNPPKSTGREEFGAGYASRFRTACEKHSLANEDTIATATAFTVESIRFSYERFVRPMLTSAPTDYIVAGGGARNATLMRWLANALEPLGCTVTTTDTLRASFAVERSRRVCVAGVRDVASSAIECPRSHGCVAACDPGPGDVQCISRFLRRSSLACSVAGCSAAPTIGRNRDRS